MDGARESPVPFVVADLSDGESNHLIYLQTDEVGSRVTFSAGHLRNPSHKAPPEAVY